MPRAFAATQACRFGKDRSPNEQGLAILTDNTPENPIVKTEMPFLPSSTRCPVHVLSDENNPVITSQALVDFVALPSTERA
jgi:hypothetical protein